MAWSGWFDTLASPLLLCDDSMRLLRLNAAAEQILAVSENQAKGLLLTDLCPALNKGDREPGFRMLTGRTLVRELRWEFNGQHLAFDCWFNPVADAADGALSQWLIEWIDLDPVASQAGDKMRRVEVDAFTRMGQLLAHEIRNPLGGMRGAAQLLRADLEDASQRNCCDLIIREVDRLNALIERFGQEGLVAHRAPTNVHQVIEDACRLSELEAAGQRTITRRFDPSIPSLILDASALMQVILNLVRNAYQASADEITITTRVLHSERLLGEPIKSVLMIAVDDNGQGVDAGLEEVLFMPMVSGHDGQGLGLAVSQQIAAAHGGELRFKRRPVGATFELVLPMVMTE